MSVLWIFHLPIFIVSSLLTFSGMFGGLSHHLKETEDSIILCILSTVTNSIQLQPKTNMGICTQKFQKVNIKPAIWQYGQSHILGNK
jgi:hypothetical protein